MLFSLTPLAKPFFRAATCNPVDRNGKFPLQPKPVSYLCTDSVTIQPSARYSVLDNSDACPEYNGCVRGNADQHRSGGGTSYGGGGGGARSQDCRSGMDQDSDSRRRDLVGLTCGTGGTRALGLA